MRDTNTYKGQRSPQLLIPVFPSETPTHWWDESPLCWPDSRYLQQISHPFDNFTFPWNTQNTKMKVSFHLYHLFYMVASWKQHRLVYWRGLWAGIFPIRLCGHCSNRVFCVYVVGLMQYLNVRTASWQTSISSTFQLGNTSGYHG